MVHGTQTPLPTQLVHRDPSSHPLSIKSIQGEGSNQVTTSVAPQANPAGVGATNKTPSALAPVVRNAWYVLAARDEFDRTLRQRWILGQPVCYFESSDGQPVVLDDRCAHRRFPLSHSNLRDDDTIRCRYHGFTYGTDGRCLAVPGAEPGGIGVRKYPATQRGPWVWIWTGDDPEAADEKLIPWPDDELAGGHYVYGYYFNNANYSIVHENLLDLTHLECLHGIGTTDFTETRPTPATADQLPAAFADRAVGYVKDLDSTIGAFALSSGEDANVPVRRYTVALSVTPALAYAVERLEPHDPAAAKLHKVVIPHAITPGKENETHQFWMFWQDVPFSIGEQAWKEALTRIFLEDIEAVELIQQYVDCEDRQGVVEHSLAADVPGLRLRRMLQRLARTEQR